MKHPTLLKLKLGTLVVAMCLGMRTICQAKTFVIPHVFDTTGGVTDGTNFTFDTFIFLTHNGGLVPGGVGSAAVDIYIFDDSTGTPMVSGTGNDVANPFNTTVSPAAPNATFSLDNAITTAGGFAGSPMTGFSMVVVDGDADLVNVTAELANVKTGPADVSVFGYEPHEIIITPALTPPTTQLLLNGIAETPGSPNQFGGCTDTLIKAIYTTGLIDGQTPTNATIQLHLFNPDGSPMMGASGAAADPFNFVLNGNNRVLSITVEDLINAAGGFFESPVNGYALATLSGDWQNVTMASYVIESNTGPGDLVRFQKFQPITIPEPASMTLLAIGGVALFLLGRRGNGVSLRPMLPLRTAICIATLAWAGFSANANAAILLDQSPATTGATVLSDGLDNRSTSQNFAEDFSFATAVKLTGMDIYMNEDTPELGDSVTIRLYEDSAGVPGTKLSDFTETVSVIDLVGAVGTTVRVNADFSVPLELESDTVYWIGMSGTGNSNTFHLAGLGDVGGGGPVDDRTMAHFTDESFNFITGTGTGDMAFRLEGVVVPEPGSLALCSALLAAAAWKRRKVVNRLLWQ